MTNDPAASDWSSCASLFGLRQDSMRTLHPVQTALAATDTTPGAAYRALFNEALTDEELATIRAYLQQQRAYGCADFRAVVEAKTRRFASVRAAHRPAKSRVIPA